MVDLGFIAYVQSLPNHERRIFPKLKASRDGRLAHTYSRRVGYYTRQIGLTDPRKCFHSFRHTFVRKCRKARLPEDLHDYLTGHEGKKFVSRSYGDVDLDTVKQAIDELDFSEFPLEMIRSRSSSP